MEFDKEISKIYKSIYELRRKTTEDEQRKLLHKLLLEIDRSIPTTYNNQPYTERL
jgi:hypothetical protein